MLPSSNPELKSWVESAQGSEFPIQNLPFGVFAHGEKKPRVGVAIGDFVLDLSRLEKAGLLEHCGLQKKNTFRRSSLSRCPNGNTARGPYRRTCDVRDSSPRKRGEEGSFAGRKDLLTLTDGRRLSYLDHAPEKEKTIIFFHGAPSDHSPVLALPGFPFLKDFRIGFKCLWL